MCLPIALQYSAFHEALDNSVKHMIKHILRSRSTCIQHNIDGNKWPIQAFLPKPRQ